MRLATARPLREPYGLRYLGARSAWRCRRMPTCLASRCRSSLNLLSSRNSTLLSDGQLWKRSDIRSSRTCLASRSSLTSSRKRFLGRFSITLGSTAQRPHAPAPYGTFAGLLPSSPNHFRILADTLRVICISTSLPPPSAQWPVRSARKERLGKRNGSRSPKARRPSWGARGVRGRARRCGGGVGGIRPRLVKPS
jgi:hypothetical protein